MSVERYKIIGMEGSRLSVPSEGPEQSFERVALPPAFLDWVVRGRRAMYDLLEGKGSAPFFDSHLPVVVTYSSESAFPFNTGNKGVGLLPVEEKIEHYCELYQETFKRSQGMPWEKSLSLRLDAVRGFLESGDHCESSLVSLEIFQKTTFNNLCAKPLATLHYTGNGPVYKSFQINTVVQILPPEHPVYRFVFLSRQLFEYDSFHITQTQFPYAYLFYPVEVLDKTPHAVKPPEQDRPDTTRGPQWDEMSLIWEEPVLAQLSGAPAFVQRFIVKVTEEFAREQGRDRVDQELFNTVRARYEKGSAR